MVAVDGVRAVAAGDVIVTAAANALESVTGDLVVPGVARYAVVPGDADEIAVAEYEHLVAVAAGDVVVAGDRGVGAVTEHAIAPCAGVDDVVAAALESVDENVSTFNGHEHGAQVSFFLSHNRPVTGPKLHRHPYEETFIVEDGEVLFTVGESTIEARAGDIVVVPAGAPHKFVSRAATHRQVSIHSVARMETQWPE